MGESTKNANKVLAPAAVTNAGKATSLDLDFLVNHLTLLQTVALFFVKASPAKVFLNFHKAHIAFLLGTLVSIQRAKPIDEQIRQVERNIDKYVEATRLLVQQVRKVPPSPWAGTQLESSLALVILLPILAMDPRFVQAYNSNVEAYRKLVESALDSASAAVDAGRQIESETPQRIEELTQEIDKLKEARALDIIIKQRYLERLQFVELDLMTRVQETRVLAESAVRDLQEPLEKARKAKLITLEKGGR